MTPLRIAVVGCGEAAQILHLPSLRYLGDLFVVTAVCDVSATVAREVAAQWAVPFHTTDHDAATARGDVDAVLVTTPDEYHAEVALAALAAGKHVLVEKPLCMTLRECDELAAAAAHAGTVAQIGYMRRYAPAFLEAVRVVPELGEIRFARALHVLGLNPLIVEQTAKVVRGDDLPPPDDRRAALLAEATGDAPKLVQDAYALLLSLASHDLSAVRELLGRPRRVRYAGAWRDAWLVSAALEYDGFVLDYIGGFDRIPRVESYIEVFGEQSSLRVDFQTSFVRNLPTLASVTRSTDRGVERRELQPSWSDPFVEEWRAFHANVTRGCEPKTSIADFRADLELFGELAAAMQD